MNQKNEQFEQLRKLILDLEPDFIKFFQKGNSAAGTRIRGGMQKIRNQIKELRDQVQKIKKEGSKKNK